MHACHCLPVLRDPNISCLARCSIFGSKKTLHGLGVWYEGWACRYGPSAPVSAYLHHSWRAQWSFTIAVKELASNEVQGFIWRGNRSSSHGVGNGGLRDSTCWKCCSEFWTEEQHAARCWSPWSPRNFDQRESFGFYRFRFKWVNSCTVRRTC